MSKIARVFPRKTNASPDDSLAFFGFPPEPFPEVDEVHVSVSFTQDIILSLILAKAWERVAPVRCGGPALKDKGENFVPGMYLKQGYVITSRGCPNKCWFCEVWKRDGQIRELPISDGWILQDDNILACSRSHISQVFEMLKRNKSKGVELKGMEAARVDTWSTNQLWGLRPKHMFFAYDTPDDLEPLIVAGRILRYADFTRSHLRCYVLIGYKGDTIKKAEYRLFNAWKAGFLPCAMLWDDGKTEQSIEWKRFQRSWMRPAAIKTIMKDTNLKHY